MRNKAFHEVTLKDIDPDWLQRNHVRLYYFGLGFIQLKIDETYRLHFYTPELPSITEDIHNHRYDFTSRILAGEITNYVYDVGEGDTHVMSNESCNPSLAAPPRADPCGARLSTLTSRTHSKGSHYVMDANTFHRVAADSCITYLERSPYKKEFAQIVVPQGESSVCPFSKSVPEPELWQLIRNML